MSKEWDILHTSTMPVIALRGLTVFPNVLIHFEVSRVTSVRALEAAMTAGSPVFLVGQRSLMRTICIRWARSPVYVRSSVCPATMCG